MKLVAQNKVTTDNLWLKVRFLLSTRKMATINITSKDIFIYLKSDISRGTLDMRVLGNQETGRNGLGKISITFVYYIERILYNNMTEIRISSYYNKVKNRASLVI
jgi:hypothetical protein